MFSLLIGLSLALFIMDVLFKQQIEERVELGQEKDLIKGKVLVRKVYNKGFMLHFMEKYPLLIKITTGTVAVGIAVYNVILYSKKGHFIEKLGLSIFTAGAASNSFDRLVRGKVIDYIGFHSKHTFLARLTVNLADVLILVGAMIIMIMNLVRRKR